MQTIKILLTVISITLTIACSPQEESRTKLYPSKNYSESHINYSSLKRKQKVYVPIYSDIYHKSGEKRYLLTATLSVRNTSLKDSMYVKSVDYYDSEGILLRNYIEKTILIKPLSSLEFIVEYEESKGGAGANFIIDWGTNGKLRPLFQAIMTGSYQGVSLVTDGIEMEEY